MNWRFPTLHGYFISLLLTLFFLSFNSFTFICNVHREQLLEGSSPFGIGYTFSLHNSPTSVSCVGGVEEYLVLDEALELLCQEEGLEIVFNENFHDYFQREVRSNDVSRDMLGQMEVLNPFGTMSDFEWSLAHLYQVVVIQKRELLEQLEEESEDDEEQEISDISDSDDDSQDEEEMMKLIQNKVENT